MLFENFLKILANSFIYSQIFWHFKHQICSKPVTWFSDEISPRICFYFKFAKKMKEIILAAISITRKHTKTEFETTLSQLKLYWIQTPFLLNDWLQIWWIYQKLDELLVSAMSIRPCGLKKKDCQDSWY